MAMHTCNSNTKCGTETGGLLWSTGLQTSSSFTEIPCFKGNRQRTVEYDIGSSLELACIHGCGHLHMQHTHTHTRHTCVHACCISERLNKPKSINCQNELSGKCFPVYIVLCLTATSLTITRFCIFLEEENFLKHVKLAKSKIE